MSIALKLFLAISLERKSVFREVRIKVVRSERNKMTAWRLVLSMKITS